MSKTCTVPISFAGIEVKFDQPPKRVK